MVFSSIIFIFVFLPIFLLCYFLVKNNKYRNIILLIFSLLFYAWGEPLYILLMLFSIIINYYLTIKMANNKSHKLLILIITINLALLFIFKYLNFSINTFNYLFNINLKEVNLALPIGISFYTFQALSYVIDVYRGKIKPQKNILYLACYITAFPQLIAGPIVRYETIEDELINRKITLNSYTNGIRRFIIGLSKKVLIANNVAFISEQIFNQGASTYGFIGVLIGSIAYTLQIYFDFSGYSDMAIGLGKMLGFNYLENFNNPYQATSITDFWRRWHISLSSFFRDYVYIPLGGNRVSKKRHILNIIIVWALTGLWHGSAWNFVIWGLYYAIFLILEKYVYKLEKSPLFFQHLYSLLIINFGWLIFRASSFTELKESIISMFGYYGLGNINLFKYTGILSFRFVVAFILGIILSSSLIKYNKKNNITFDIILALLFILSIIFILVGSYNPFIYFRF
jgi:alginate O-acetyltransferase complex protein AlgI